MCMSVISFFKNNKIPVEPELKGRLYVKYHNRDLQREEIKRILDHTRCIRDKVYFLMLAESGARPYTLVQLRYKHIKDEFEKGNIPMKIELPAEIVKDRVGNRWTFIGEDCYNLLKEYLSSRQPLDDESLIFAPEVEARMKHAFLRPETFNNQFSKIVLKLGLVERREPNKPKKLYQYCLRKYFRNNIRVSDTAFREFWMGHTFGTDESYLSRDVEKHREEYAKAYNSIRIYKPEIPKTVEKLQEYYEAEINTLKQAIIEIARASGVADDERLKQIIDTTKYAGATGFRKKPKDEEEEE